MKIELWLEDVLRNHKFSEENINKIIENLAKFAKKEVEQFKRKYDKKESKHLISITTNIGYAINHSYEDLRERLNVLCIVMKEIAKLGDSGYRMASWHVGYREVMYNEGIDERFCQIHG